MQRYIGSPSEQELELAMTALPLQANQAASHQPPKAKRKHKPQQRPTKYCKRPRRSTSITARATQQTEVSSASSDASDQADSDPNFDARSNASSGVSSAEASDLEMESDGVLEDGSPRQRSKKAANLTVLYHGPNSAELAEAAARAKPSSGKSAVLANVGPINSSDGQPWWPLTIPVPLKIKREKGVP